MLKKASPTRNLRERRYNLSMWNDLRFGLRTLRRSPLFTSVAVLSLALGIGANTAIFSLLNQVMLRMLPVAEPERLAVFHTEGQRNGWSSSDNSEAVFSYPMYKDLRDRNQVFSGVIARSSAAVTILYRGQSERASAELVSGNFFDVLGVKAAMGRVLVQDDDGAPGAHPVVMLTYGYWKRRFGANAGILNQTVNLNGHPMTIVGVAPAGVPWRAQRPDARRAGPHCDEARNYAHSGRSQRSRVQMAQCLRPVETRHFVAAVTGCDARPLPKCFGR